MKKLLLLFLTLIAAATVYGQSALTEGDRLFDEGKYEDAKRQYLLHKVNSNERLDYADTRIAQCDECMRLLPIADYLFTSEQWVQAKENYDQVMAINPKDPTAFSRLGQIFTRATIATTPAATAPTPMPATSPRPAVATTRLVNKGVKVYDGNDYRNQLSKAQAFDLFDGTPAYKPYRYAMKLNRAANGTLWPGVGITAFGILDLAGGITATYYYDYGAEYMDQSLAILITGVGTALLATGIACKVVAKKKVSQAVQLYNVHGVTSYLEDPFAPTLDFGITPVGVGLSLTF